MYSALQIPLTTTQLNDQYKASVEDFADLKRVVFSVSSYCPVGSADGMPVAANAPTGSQAARVLPVSEIVHGGDFWLQVRIILSRL